MTIKETTINYKHKLHQTIRFQTPFLFILPLICFTNTDLILVTVLVTSIFLRSTETSLLPSKLNDPV